MHNRIQDPKRALPQAMVLAAAALALLLFTSILTGCGAMQTGMKHAESSAIGLDRVITLYSSDGHVIKTWRARTQVECDGGFASFIVNGKTVKVEGFVSIEEQ